MLDENPHGYHPTVTTATELQEPTIAHGEARAETSIVLAGEIVKKLSALQDDDQRSGVLYLVFQYICEYCGRVLDGQRCFCTRDD